MKLKLTTEYCVRFTGKESDQREEISGHDLSIAIMTYQKMKELLNEEIFSSIQSINIQWQPAFDGKENFHPMEVEIDMTILNIPSTVIVSEIYHIEENDEKRAENFAKIISQKITSRVCSITETVDTLLKKYIQAVPGYIKL